MVLERSTWVFVGRGGAVLTIAGFDTESEVGLWRVQGECLDGTGNSNNAQSLRTRERPEDSNATPPITISRV